MSWEDKYYRIKSEKEALSKKYNDINDTARLLQTKCAKLESFRKKIINGASFKAASSNRLQIDTSTFDSTDQPSEIRRDYEDLFRSFETLQKDYRAVVMKHKSSIQVISNLKKELQSTRHRQGANSQKNDSRKTHGNSVQRVLEVSSKETTACNHRQDDILEQLQNRLYQAEKQLESLTVDSEVPGDREPRDNRNNSSENIQGTSHQDEENENQRLRENIHELSIKLKLLQAKHDYAETKVQEQRDQLKKMCKEHGLQKSKLSAMRKELHRYKQESEALELKASHLEEFKDQADELAAENEYLESQITKLCETPYTLNQVGEEREINAERLKSQEIKMERDLLMVEKTQLEQENSKLLSLLNATKDQDHSSKKEIICISIGTNTEQDCEDLSKAHWECNQKEKELDQINNILKVQVAINESLQIQFKKREEKLNKEIVSLKDRIQELSLESMQRQRQPDTKFKSFALPNNSNKDSVSQGLNQPVMSENDVGKPGLGIGKNILEINIIGAELYGEGLSKDWESFLVLDFHTFASQFSDVARGDRPIYDFTATFKMETDCIYPIASALRQHIRIEIYVVRNGLPQMFAYALASASSLMGRSKVINLPKLELRSAERGTLLGSLNMMMKLTQPICIEEETGHTDQETGSMINCNSSILPDAIRITIKSVSLVKGQIHPETNLFFVHYRFLSFADEITVSKRSDGDGLLSFSHTSSFPVILPDQKNFASLISSLAENYINFSLFGASSDARSEEEIQEFLIIGEAHTPLSNIFTHNSSKVAISTDIISPGAKRVGSLTIEVILCMRFSQKIGGSE